MKAARKYEKLIRLTLSSDQDELIPMYSFGDTDEMSDNLSKLVLEGKKTATTSCYKFYEPDEIPQINDINIILDSKYTPVCTIKLTGVRVMKFKDIGQEEVNKEGEGDLTIDWWKKAHADFFRPYYEKTLGEDFDEDELIVFEEFKVIDVYEAPKQLFK